MKHTVNSRDCVLIFFALLRHLRCGGPHRRFAPLLSRTLRRIPQEVGVVATYDNNSFSEPLHRYSVSIPQAVGTVATQNVVLADMAVLGSFNTVNGRYYFNRRLPYHFCFTFALLRHLRCADFIVALLLCRLAPFGAYHKR